jgi:hypothetical protein
MTDRKYLDELLEEIDREKGEKTLEEALDEMDRWGEHTSEAIARLSTDEVIEYFRQAEERFEKLLGHPVKKAVRQPRFKIEE